MKLEDEKKLVADWMRKPRPPYPQSDWWNPQTDRNCWSEIWNNMDSQLRIDYLQNLESLLGATSESINTEVIFSFHIAGPEISWIALISALLEGSE